MVFPLPAPAQAGRVSAPAAGRNVWFDIPAQPLAQALTRFGEQAGLAVLVDSALTSGRHSTAIHGYYLPPIALQMLLRESGLTAHYTNADAFTVVADLARKEYSPAPMNNAGDTSTLGLGGNRYAVVLQRALQRSLCQSPQTRPGAYRAALQLWLAADGSAQRVELLHSTGSISRDEAILVRLRGLRLDLVPQSHLPQPLTILLLPGTNKDCQLSGISRH